MVTTTREHPWPASRLVRAERIWQLALQLSSQAEASGSLVPLATEVLAAPQQQPFVLRRLLSTTPKHLRRGGPKPNPFLPWEQALEVERLSSGHVVLLNKYPVQAGHLLLITDSWQPQSGWLSADDWRGVSFLARDTGGLWFFNSCAASGASQPHRHLQLLPRQAGEASTPLAAVIQAQLDRGERPWPWAYRLSRRTDALWGRDLAALYLEHAEQLGLGHPCQDPQPRHPYNLLFDDNWLLTVRRTQEHCAGFSLNALAFAGYLLATESSDLELLEREGPWALLQAVAAAPDVSL
uniref:ATP adenylyltransferase n=1 Tax=Cyanobium sp. TaxID=2164130 RepID=UPI004048FB69